MLRVFEIKKKLRVEILPKDGIYSVLELGQYEIQYSSTKINSHIVFIEDLAIDIKYIESDNSNIILRECRYFEDYFGYANLNINGEEYLFNIKIEKLKLSEIEDIFNYLWQKENRLLNIFFSRSSYKLDFKKNGFELEETSKILLFLETFIKVLNQLYFSFEKLPHTVLRTSKKTIRYDSQKITPDSLFSILNNLDDINFDASFKGHYNSIKINNRHGLISNIDINDNVNSFDNYENQIILGAFCIILKKLTNLKKRINANLDLSSDNEDQYADFKDLKKIPFIKLFLDTTSLEKRTIKLYNKYKKLFVNVTPRLERPFPTSVFANRIHYKKVFELIKNLNEYTFDLRGEFNLLNINKLSHLYEVYCLYIIVDTIQNNIKSGLFNIEQTSSRVDDIIDRLKLENDDYIINLFYELKYYGSSEEKQSTLLRRIDTRNGRHYNPDFILEIRNKKQEIIKYYVLDAKYSKKYTVRCNHLPYLINKYILGTGIANNPNKKINSLSLIFPGESGENVVQSDYFEPTINLISSRPKSEKELKDYIEFILRNNLPIELTKR